jgi:hypothetical protein
VRILCLLHQQRPTLSSFAYLPFSVVVPDITLGTLKEKEKSDIRLVGVAGT